MFVFSVDGLHPVSSTALNPGTRSSYGNERTTLIGTEKLSRLTIAPKVSPSTVYIPDVGRVWCANDVGLVKGGAERAVHSLRHGVHGLH